MPTVSIIIPCYNEERTIVFLLRSLVNQTYPVSEMELIIADGMSTDHTRQIIHGFQEENPSLKIKVVDNPKKNIPSALNVALDNAIGEYIIRLDAHSVPSHTYVQTCINDLIDGKGDNVGGIWEIRPFEETWKAKCIAIAASHKLGVGDARYRYTDQAGEVDTVPFGAFRRDLIDRIGKFNENLLTNEDYEFNVRVKKSGGKVWLDPSIRTVYFARPDFSALSRQYWRYGLWKFRMLKQNPTTLKWRQALPPLFVFSLVFWGIISIIWSPCVWLLTAEVITYILVLFLATFKLGVERHDWKIGPGVTLAIMVMHFSWGSGFLWSMVKSLFGR